MYSESRVEQFLHLLVSTRRDVSAVEWEFWVFTGVEIGDHPFVFCHFEEALSGFYRLFACVDEDHDLVAVPDQLCDLSSQRSQVFGLTLSKTTWSMFRIEA